MNTKKILNQVLEEISLSKSEIKDIKNITRDFLSLLKEVGLNAKVGGSLAKGTLIKKDNKQDVDIFVIFDYSEDIVNLEKKLGKIKLPGELKKVHGSRDYFQIKTKKLILELIPVVKNNDPELAENVTDVSLRHVKYILEQTKKNPILTSEIKLAKAFCKANKFYGAEGYIKGFSGYSIEVLVIHFGSFIKFLKGVQKSKVIDTCKYFKNEKQVLTEINSSKLNSPIIVVDPTYKYRNITAGLGLKTFNNFLKVANEFLESPSKDFFKIKEINVEELKKMSKDKEATLLELYLQTNRQPGDIAGTKMKKIMGLFIKELSKKKQIILYEDFDYKGENSAKGYLIVKEKNEIEVRGPSRGLEIPSIEFKKSRKNVYEKKGYFWTKENVSLEGILKEVQKVQDDIGAKIEIKRI